MWQVGLLIVLAAAPKPAATKLASTGFTSLNVDDNATRFYSDHFAQQLSLRGLRVVTASEIATLIGFERQKQLLGCTDGASSCLAELANALGVDGVITGSLGRFGQSYQLNIKVIAAHDGNPLSIYSNRVTGEEQLLDEYGRAAERMSRELLKTGTSNLPPVPSTSSTVSAPVASQVAQAPAPSARRWAWLPAAAGVALAGTGTYFLIQARGRLNSLNEATSHTPFSTAVQWKEEGTRFQTVGFIALGAGAAALTTGGLMYFLSGRSASPTISAGAMVGQGQVGMTVSGALP